MLYISRTLILYSRLKHASLNTVSFNVSKHFTRTQFSSLSFQGIYSVKSDACLCASSLVKCNGTSLFTEDYGKHQVFDEKYRRYSSKEFDFKNDPETQSLLSDITRDFNLDSKGKDLTKTEIDVNQNEDTDKIEKFTCPSSEIEDVEEFEMPEVHPAYIPPIDLKRGKRGVFDLDELIKLLETENARDISIIEIPAEAQFGEQMVIVSALSHRHLASISSRIKRIHKQKKGPQDLHVNVEGDKIDKEWHALDLGNIILHIFMPEVRERYNLETLWQNWGQPEYDVCAEENKYIIGPDDVFWKSLEPSDDTADDMKDDFNESK